MTRNKLADAAHHAVYRAIRRGELDHPYYLPCKKCGGGPCEYHHKNYRKPLDVIPLCRWCHKREHKMLIKRFKIKIFEPGNKKSTVRIVNAPNGRHFIESGIDKTLDNIATQIEKKWPNEDYKMVPLAGHQYNFIHVGSKKEENNG